MTETPTAPKRVALLAPLTSLRFFAALLVLFHHHDEGTVPFLPEPLQHAVHRGYLGVTMFFVLSGFIMAYNYMDRFVAGKVTTKQFMVARLSRIYPVYLLSLLLLVPRFILQPEPIVKTDLPLVVITHLTLTLSWFPQVVSAWNGPAWSIGTEFFFYLAFPFLAVWFAKVPRKWLFPMMAGCFALSWIGPTLHHGYFEQGVKLFGLNNEDKETFHSVFVAVMMWPIFRIPEFMLGCLMGRLFLEQKRENWSIPKPCLTLMGGASTAWIFYLLLRPALNERTLDNTLLLGQVYGVPAFAVLIYYLANCKGIVERALSWGPLVYLGEASYSLYILHMVTKHGGSRVIEKLTGLKLENPAVAVFLMLLAVFVSILSFKYVEIPARKWIMNRFATRPAPSGF